MNHIQNNSLLVSQATGNKTNSGELETSMRAMKIFPFSGDMRPMYDLSSPGNACRDISL